MTQYNKNSRKELLGISEEDMVILVIKNTGPDVSVLIIIYN